MRKGMYKKYRSCAHTGTVYCTHEEDHIEQDRFFFLCSVKWVLTEEKVDKSVILSVVHSTQY